MSLSDPIADMLTRIRNAVRIGNETVNVKASKICKGIAQTLKDEGYIEDYDVIDDAKQGIIRIFLRYNQQGTSAIEDIQRVSKPGRRVYSSVDDLPVVMGGMGIVIVSTSNGVMSNNKCRENHCSGEILCTVN